MSTLEEIRHFLNSVVKAYQVETQHISEVASKGTTLTPTALEKLMACNARAEVAQEFLKLLNDSRLRLEDSESRTRVVEFVEKKQEFVSNQHPGGMRMILAKYGLCTEVLRMLGKS